MNGPVFNKEECTSAPEPGRIINNETVNNIKYSQWVTLIK